VLHVSRPVGSQHQSSQQPVGWPAFKCVPGKRGHCVGRGVIPELWHVANPHMWRLCPDMWRQLWRLRPGMCCVSGGCAGYMPSPAACGQTPADQAAACWQEWVVRMLHLLTYVVRRQGRGAVKSCWVDRSTVDRPGGARLVSGLTKCIHQGMTSQRGGGTTGVSKHRDSGCVSQAISKWTGNRAFPTGRCNSQLPVCVRNGVTHPLLWRKGASSCGGRASATLSSIVLQHQQQPWQQPQQQQSRSSVVLRRQQLLP
jgi:hypothetical protein